MSPLRRVNKPAVEIGNEVKNMNTMKSFEQWIEEDFSKVYRQFHKDYNFFFKKKSKRYKKMNLDARLKHFFSHSIDIDIYPKYFIKMISTLVTFGMAAMCCAPARGPPLPRSR